MGEKIRFIPLILILSACSFLIEINAFRQPKCRGKETKLTTEEMKMMADCLKEFGKTGSQSFADVPKDSMGCVGKCILQRQGLVDGAGKPSKNNIFKLVNATMDAEVAQMADEKIGKCIDESSSGIDPNDQACKTYWPLVQCVAAAFMEICADPTTTTPAS